MPAYPLYPRIHILPDALARSPGHVSEHFTDSASALSGVLDQLRDLPEPLVSRWLAASSGHIILNNQQHGFIPGENTFRQRTLEDVAWLKLALIAEPVRFLTPVGRLIACIAGWGQETKSETAPKGWEQFESGVQSCFRAGYGISAEAQQDIDAYLAEGIAHYLSDRRSLNQQDPRLEKLLASTVFDPTTSTPWLTRKRVATAKTKQRRSSASAERIWDDSN